MKILIDKSAKEGKRERTSHSKDLIFSVSFHRVTFNNILQYLVFRCYTERRNYRRISYSTRQKAGSSMDGVFVLAGTLSSQFLLTCKTYSTTSIIMRYRSYRLELIVEWWLHLWEHHIWIHEHPLCSFLKIFFLVVEQDTLSVCDKSWVIWCESNIKFSFKRSLFKVSRLL